VLLREGFEEGALGRWTAEPVWRLVERPGGPGKCAQVTATDDQIQDLVLNAHVPIVPGRPIAVCWRTRMVTGSEPLYLRVDFFGADGKQGEPYARQDLARSGPDWTENALLVSDWFPPYTRAMTVWFHQAQGSKTTALLDDIRVVDLWPAVQALLAAELPALRAQGDRLAEAAARLPGSPANDAWRALIAQRLPWFREQLAAAATLDVGSDAAARALAEPSAYVRRLGEAVTALAQGKAVPAGLLAYVTRPISSTMILPHSLEIAGDLAEEVRVRACPGESEPASLVFWAPAGLAGFHVAATDLVGPGGSIPAAKVDIHWVKAWYQGGGAPYGIAVVRDRKALVPELLLKDDSLVRVDLGGQHNSLKLSFPDGPKYVPIDDPAVVQWGSALKLDEFPVRDSPVLLPADLPAGQNKQVWVTVKVPTGLAAGSYQGQLLLTAAERGQVGTLSLVVDVLPFSLASPKSHWDPESDFTYSLYYWGWLDPAGQGSISFNRKSEGQFRAELEYMRDRGVVAPCMIWPASLVYGDEPAFRRHLQIAREVGFAGRPLVFGSSDLIGAPTAPEDLAKLKANIAKTVDIAREYGFPEVYFYGLDEATGETLRNERVAWQAVHDAGGKVIVSGFQGQFEAVGDLLDLFNRAGDPAAEEPKRWHDLGHRLWNYANPQTPVEDPLLYRRNFGLYLWQADFDGANTYCFMDSEGLTWNDFDGPAYRDHAVAYPTVEGVVATLAMEGLREAVDDVRYATTLRQAIRQALQGGAAEIRAKAASASEWLEGLDARTADLDVARAEMVRRLLELAP
jgi:hypothetical protein